jgi:hypothetical protein
MATFAEVAALIPTLCGQLPDAADADVARASVMAMKDADVVRVLEETAALAREVEKIKVMTAGVIAVRSRRERGHAGLSASRGHRSAAALIQDVTGSTKADANRTVRVGEALLDDSGDDSSNGLPDCTPQTVNPVPRPRYHPLRDALRDGRLTPAQFDAIRRGLGEPPEISADAVDGATRARLRQEARDTWVQAAEHLIDEAAARTVEELWQQARTIRDLLDPDSAETRFLERFERRSFRTYRGQDGQKRASIVLDDEGDLFLEAVLAAALRPRRGGPRFVDSAEKAQAAELADDPRTNDQLAYDLIMDVLRAGALADAETVFGTRQAGVRLVQTVDAAGTRAPVAHSEDHLVSVPGAVADQHICESGFTPIIVDSCGKPLDVGREQRLFTPRQRIVLSIRDGGCRWKGCDRPASYCEAHHIDEWQRDQGRTDVDRGILLCRFHHMELHHGGWWITREGDGDFVLHHPSGETSVMRDRTVLAYAFGGIDPPPKRFRPAA